MDKESTVKEERRTMWKKFLKDAVISLPIAILLVVFLNIYWNRRYTYGFGDDFTMKMSLRSHLGRTVEMHEDVMAVNVSYDNMFVDKTIKRRNVGKKSITDRKKLNEFLTALKENDGYRYILLDVDFSAGYVSDYDDSLFQTIASMRDIVVATSNPASDPEMIKEKTATAIYYVRKSGDDFMKYTFMDPVTGKPSVALKMWQDMTGGTYEKTGWGYRMNGRSCYNSIIPDFRFMILDDLKHTDQERIDLVQMLNLGTDIMTAMEYVDDYITKFDDKIILVGDWMEHDIHDTIIGPQPGTSIIYNAYLSLVNGDNVRSIWIMLLLTMILWVEIMFMMRGLFNIRCESWEHRVEKMKSEHKLTYVVLKFLSYVLVFFTYAFPLKCFEVIIYKCNGTIVNTLILSVIFTILSEIISELNQYTSKK